MNIENKASIRILTRYDCNSAYKENKLLWNLTYIRVQCNMVSHFASSLVYNNVIKQYK